MKRLPVGTPIRFVKTLEDSFEFGRQWCKEGQTGTVLGFDCKEGYMVQTDAEKKPFGATRHEFEPIKT